MPETDDSLKTLNKKRASVKSKLTLFDKYLTVFEGLESTEINRTKTIELEQRIASAETLLCNFDDIQSEIECEAENPEEHYTEREEFENKFYSILARAKSLSERCIVENGDAKSRSSAEFAAPSTVFEGVKLPQIELPKFDGSFETWLEFRDIFESLIHNNAQINKIQKFHYLRASLIGSAPQVIQSLEFTTDNYDIAWNTLCDRFNNKQLLIHNHLRAIFNTESVVAASATKIRHLYENLFKHLNSLKQLGEPTDSWDTLLIFIISSKLDKNTAQDWEKRKANNNAITLNDFKEFLKKRANLLETMEVNLEYTNEKRNFNRQNNNNTKIGNAKASNYSRGLVGNTENSGDVENSKLKYTCYNCKGDHSLFYCPDFLKLSIKDRISKVKTLQLCMNCLRRSHLSKDCKWSGCKTCGGKHNTVLHETKETTNSAVAVGQENVCVTENSNFQNNSIIDSTNCTLATAQNAILSTAKVQVRSKRDSVQFLTARALLDCGSQSSFITSNLCEKLKLNKTKFQLAVSGINDKLSFANYKCDLNIRSTNSSFSLDLSCFVLDKITTDIPGTPIDIKDLNIPVNLSLADPEFHIPQPIDILIGADAFWQILSIGRINLGLNTSVLQNTRLGWIVAGSISMPKNKTQCNLSTNVSVQEQLARFWEVEEIETKKPWSIEEQSCEKHFIEHLSTSDDGRFIVSLPFKQSPNKLGESRETAIKRFVSLERRLMSNKTLQKLYTDFLSEYERLGHMTEVTDRVNEGQIEYFMPHHGVLKESNISTKLRVVFNASSATSTGLSLNDLQMTGPIIQQDLLSIILRFRMRRIVLSSDIKMMYRQVLINPEQRSLQKIVWRSNPNEPIKTFELNTVTYGTTAASFLAIRCLHQVANECETEHPRIADIIQNDMYVDDLLTSVDTQEEAKYICETISRYLLKRGFELRKWKSNDQNVLLGLNTEDTSNVVEFSVNKEQGTKTLGLSWKCDRDILTYRIRNSIDLEPNQVTKRVILSRIATIFDPLGLVGPCIITAKVLLQKLWSENVTWDQPLPHHILTSWLEFSSQLDKLNDLIISRKVTCDNPTHLSLHGFADASETSYGACVYVVTENLKGERASNLLCAKSKVAPLKSLTMPRLELCAALVLSQLIFKVLNSINIKIDKVYCWSDSTIVLAWLRTPPNVLKPFVANRVSEIQKTTNSFEWKHVPTLDNPADIISRGLEPKQLIKSEMWFHGPLWLVRNSNEWPSIQPPIVDLPEKRNRCLVTSIPHTWFPFERFSNWNKLKRAFAYVLRFVKNCKAKPDSRNLLHLTVDELNESSIKLIKIAQQESFREDYITLQKKGQLSSNSKILSLHPFIDEQGILRVGGRLTNSEYPYSKKFPILLLPGHHITKLIFENEHQRLLHAGPQLLLSSIRDTFWPISGRNFSRKIVRNCIKCARYDIQKIQPIMGDLPEARVRPTTPFSIVGVDYAGPFSMKDKRGRGCKPIKCWVALFVCFSTRAIHLELVLSLSSDDFLQAFNRFISRRGRPIEVFSDNGTNFVKANKELREIGEFLQNNHSYICDAAANMSIKWHFIPTNSPHFGGIWEAGVKSLKHHLKRVLASYTLFFFDFQTLLIRIEAILNSRPLSPLSSSPDDLTPLSPAHFLIGKSTMSLPDPLLPNVKENRLSQYQLLQKLYEHFWNRWSREYISELQQRRQWKKSQGSLEIGQLVLVKDDNLPPAKWRLGRVLNLIAGKDGASRVASIKTADGIISRAVVRLCPLPIVS